MQKYLLDNHTIFRGISIQLMYNEEELQQQLGAKPVRGIEPQLRRNKRVS